MQDTDEAYEDLPIILLKYQDEQYSLFSQKDNTVCLFGLDYKPETIDIPLEEGDQYNTILFDSPLYYTILELKNFLAIEKADVTVRFPSLDIEFHEDLAHVKNLSVYELYSMHTQLMIVNGMKEEDIPLFEIVLIKHHNCLKDRLGYLKNLIMEGGVPTNPIVVDDTEEVEEVVTHSHESLDSHDELTADDLPIVIEDDVIEDDVIDEDQEETITLDQKVDIGKVEANENENELEYEGFDGSAYVEEEVEGQVDEVEYDAYDDAELHDLDADLQEAGADGLVYEDEIDGQTYTIVAAGYEKEADADPLDPEHAKDYQDIAEQGDAHIELEITNDQIIDTEGGQEQDDVEVDQDYLEEEQYLEQELEPELVQDSAQDIEGDMIENIPPQDHVIEKNTPMEVVLDPSFKTFLVEENDITENGKRELDVTTSPGPVKRIKV